jgi:ATP-dependent RNA helicase RhlE
MLILAPTRELCVQVAEEAERLSAQSGLRVTMIYGGVGMGPQIRDLERGVDLIVATPGRMLDHLRRGNASISKVQTLVLDEADRMLDMGFIHDIRRVIAELPKQRQTLMFSATMPKEIRTLADTLLQSPVEVTIPSDSPAADTVEQFLYHVEPPVKMAVLEALLKSAEIKRALVFTRTKHGADKVARRLARDGIVAEAMHSNKSQGARTRALESFRKGITRVLVASDIVARGLDVDGITHVINYDLPGDGETYVRGQPGARLIARRAGRQPGQELVERDAPRLAPQQRIHDRALQHVLREIEEER